MIPNRSAGSTEAQDYALCYFKVRSIRLSDRRITPEDLHLHPLLSVMFKGILLVFLGACSFGILSTFVKIGYSEGYTLGQITGAQAFTGCVILWLMHLLFVQQKQPLSISKKTGGLAALGSSTGLVSIFYYQCVSLLPASIAILLLMQFTWISMLLEFIFYRKKASAGQIVAVLFVLAGTALAGDITGGKIDYTIAGIVYGLLAALCYSVFLLVSGRIANEMHPVTKSATILTGATIVICTLFPPTFLWSGVLTEGLWKWALVLSVFGTVIPPLMFSYGIPKAGVGVSSIVSSVELPVAILMSTMVLGERVSAIQWTGVAVILFAVVLSNMDKIRKASQGFIHS